MYNNVIVGNETIVQWVGTRLWAHTFAECACATYNYNTMESWMRELANLICPLVG